jgi:hypothetical protein
LLAQNKYYVVPVVNPDGVEFIGKNFAEQGRYLHRRKNMNPNAMTSSTSNTPC